MIHVRFGLQTLAAVCAAGVCVAGWQRTGPPAVQPPSPTPTRLWQVAEPARGGPAIDDGAAYFLTARHEVLSVERNTGNVRWRRKTYESGELLSGAAVLIGGPNLVVGDYNLLAFDRDTGSLLWRFIPAEGFAPGIYLGAIAGGAAMAGSASGHVYAVDTAHGALRWATSIAQDGRTTVYAPAAHGSVVAAAYTVFSAPPRGGLALLDASSGRLLWKRAFPLPDDGLLSSNWAGGPVFLGDVVVVSSGDGNIRGFDLETGDIRWTIPRLEGQLLFPIAADHDFRALTDDGDLLISSSSTGVVVAYDAATREERWRYVGTGLGSAAFRISAENGRVYVPFLNGLLVSLDSASGQERWRLGTFASAFLWPPAPGGDRLLVTGGGDGLVALEDPR
ncbi:MAG TPA: PQQ-binding-like beta-propeller repeat protein [Vicinamibacterales bacterium]|nr:PQQ-binding-like beta-propeller repeat protein [Vicinamibacterales bacterium]